MALMAVAKLKELASNPQLSDEEVVRRVLQGDTPLFEVLMRRNNQRVYRAVRAILRQESEVEEAMQQAYVSAYANLGQFEGAARFSTWLVRIAVNEALGRLRRRSRLVVLDGQEDLEQDEIMSPRPPRPSSPEENAMQRELVDLLESALDTLPEIYSLVFTLREVEGMDTAEVALALEVSEEVVKTRLHRARGMLRENLFSRVGPQAQEAFRFYAPRCDRVVAAVLQAIRES